MLPTCRYEFLGKLMGLALRTANHLNLDLPSMVWKQILGVPVTFEDLDAIDRFACMVRVCACVCVHGVVAEA